MSEYISREELIEALETDYNSDWDRLVDTEGYVEGVRDEYDDVLTIVCGMKAADVQPVKHGRWIDIYEYCKALDLRPTGLEEYYWCSECDKAEKKTSDFCPNCGARMDLKED